MLYECLFSKFHNEGTFALKYKQQVVAPFINCSELQEVIGNVKAFVVGTMTRDVKDEADIYCSEAQEDQRWHLTG